MKLKLKPPFSALFAGKTKSGKTYLMRHIMKLLCKDKLFHWGIVICPTAHVSGDYDWLPERARHSMFSEELIRSMINIQSKNGKVPCFLILDDCIGKAKWNSDIMKELITTARHYNISVLLCLQYVNALPATWREQITYSFIFRQTTDRAIKAAHDSYGQELSLPEFRKFMAEACKDYACMFAIQGGDIEVIKAPAKQKTFKLYFDI